MKKIFALVIMIILVIVPTINTSAEAQFGWEDDLFHLYDIGLTFAVPVGAVLAGDSELAAINEGSEGLEPTTIFMLYVPQKSIACIIGERVLDDPDEFDQYADLLAQYLAHFSEVSLEDVRFVKTDFFAIGVIVISFLSGDSEYTVVVVPAPFGVYSLAINAPKGSGADGISFMDELLAPMR